MNTKVKSNMTNQIKYYRSVLNSLLEQIQPDETSKIRIEWKSGDPEAFKHMRMSHCYADQVYYHLLEARMQLGNLLKYISDKPNPYREAALKRLSDESDHIPDKQDKEDTDLPLLQFSSNKVELLDIIRETLDEMQNRLNDITHGVDDDRVDIHLNEAISNVSLGRNYCGKILGCIRDIRKIND